MIKKHLLQNYVSFANVHLRGVKNGKRIG